MSTIIIINIKSTIPTTIMFYTRLFFWKQKELVEYLCWPLYAEAFYWKLSKLPLAAKHKGFYHRSIETTL